MPKIQSTSANRGTKPIFSALVALLGTIGSVQAEPLKSMIGEMARTTKDAKAALSSNDRGTFDAILRAYGDEAKAGIALFPGGSARNKDLRGRFSTFAATAEAARQSGSDPAKFKAAFGSIVGQCRSCHAVYK